MIPLNGPQAGCLPELLAGSTSAGVLRSPPAVLVAGSCCAKYAGKHRLGMKELRRRFCDQGWRFAHNGVAFTGASSVTVKRYRYRATHIATPWTPKPQAASVTGS
jgi:hypothetical protein